MAHKCGSQAFPQFTKYKDQAGNLWNLKISKTDKTLDWISPFKRGSRPKMSACSWKRWLSVPSERGHHWTQEMQTIFVQSPTIPLGGRLLRRWLPYSSKGPWKKQVIWTPFSQDSGLAIVLRWHWSYLWMTFDRLRMEVMHPSWSSLISQWLWIPSIIVSFWAGSGN